MIPRWTLSLVYMSSRCCLRFQEGSWFSGFSGLSVSIRCPKCELYAVDIQIKAWGAYSIRLRVYPMNPHGMSASEMSSSNATSRDPTKNDQRDVIISSHLREIISNCRHAIPSQHASFSNDIQTAMSPMSAGGKRDRKRRMKKGIKMD